MEKAEEASSWDPQCTTPELKELIEILTLGCWPFMAMEDKSILHITDNVHFSPHHVFGRVYSANEQSASFN